MRQAKSMNRALRSAVLHGLFHVAIKTSDLESTRAFWRDIIGLREVARPDFGYPGAWLGCSQPGGQAIIHIYAGGPALGASGIAPRGTGAIDHVSLSCSGYRDFVARFKDAGLPFCEFVVPGATLWQLFVYDPSGVQLELTFEGSVEGDELPDMTPGRAYVAGADFYDASSYPKHGAPLWKKNDGRFHNLSGLATEHFGMRLLGLFGWATCASNRGGPIPFPRLGGPALAPLP